MEKSSENENKNENEINNEFFILSEMKDDGGEISFAGDIVYGCLTECVDRVDNRIGEEIARNASTPEEAKEFYRPTKEELYNSLFTDKFVCYVIGDGSDDLRYTFHITKITIGNKVDLAKLSYCQR